MGARHPSNRPASRGNAPTGVRDQMASCRAVIGYRRPTPRAFEENDTKFNPAGSLFAKPARRKRVRKSLQHAYNGPYVHAGFRVPGRKPRSEQVLSATI